MPTELEKLLLKLEVDTLQMRRALRDAEKDVGGYERNARRSFAGVGTAAQAGADQINAALKRAAGAAVAYFSAAKALETLQTAANLNRDAAAAGLLAAEYQELAFAASTVGVANEQFLGMAGQFASQMGELRAQTGGFYEFLSKHLPTVRDQIAATRTLGEAYEVVADTARQLASDEERTIFVAKAFGEEGRKLSRLFKDGADGLRAAREEARALGVVLDQETTDAAERAGEEFNRLTSVLGTRFQAATVSAANALRPLLASMSEFVDESNALRTAQKGVFGGEGAEQLRRAAEILRKDIEEARDAVNTPASERGFFASIIEYINPAVNQLDALVGKLADVELALVRAGNAGRFAAPAIAAAASGASGADAAPGGGLRLQAAAEPIPEWVTTIDTRGADALRRLETERRQAVGDTLGVIRARYDEELSTFQGLLDEKLISEEEFSAARASLNQIAEREIADAMESQRAESAQALSELSSLLESSLSAPLRDAFNGGMQSADVYFQRMAAGFAEMLTQALVIKPIVESLTASLGGGGGPLAALFGGFRAAGGPVLGGTPYVVGERGPEIVVPSASGRVVPNHAIGGGGGPPTVINIDARGADTGAAARVAAAVAEIERRRPAPAAALAADRRRFPARR